MVAGPLPSPSSLYRLARCLVSEAYPHSRVEASAEAVAGHVAHRFLELWRERGRDEAIAQAPVDHLDALLCLDLERLPEREAFAAEVALAFDPWTERARVLGTGLTREQARDAGEPQEVIGTVDVLGLEGDSTVVVYDYKTGRGWVEPAAENWQLWTYLLMAARAYGATRAHGGIIRASERGVWYDNCEMDSLDLSAHAARLRELYEARARVLADPDRAIRVLVPHEGSHCRYCPAASRCPPRVRAVQALASGTAAALAHLGLTADPLDNETAALAWRRLQNAQLTLDRVKTVLLEHARQAGPIDLGGGLELGERAVTREAINPERAAPVLASLYGPQLGARLYDAAARSRVTLTWDGLRKGLARHVVPERPGAKITWELNATRQALRAAGALSAAESTVVDEHEVTGRVAAAGDSAAEL